MKEILITMLCDMVAERLEVTREVEFTWSVKGSDHFWVRVGKAKEGTRREKCASIKAGSGFRPRQATPYFHEYETNAEIVEALRKLLNGFNYGYNCDYHGIYFQFPDGYQTEILTEFDPPSFISDYSGEMYSVSKMADINNGLTKRESCDTPSNGYVHPYSLAQ